MSGVCAQCKPGDPAARYADTCVRHRIEEGLPMHYFDCDALKTYGYGARDGECDCTAIEDIEELLGIPS